MPNSQSIVGTWSTSFIAWHPVGPDGPIIPFFVANSFMKWKNEPQIGWLDTWNAYADDADNAGILEVLSVLAPAPLATLSCFKFGPQGTFSLWVRHNAQTEGMSSSTYTGEYTSEVYDDMGVAGGTITIRNDDQSVHATLKYLLQSKTEMNFIIAHGADEGSIAPSGAGTMKKVSY